LLIGLILSFVLHVPGPDAGWRAPDDLFWAPLLWNVVGMTPVSGVNFYFSCGRACGTLGMFPPLKKSVYVVVMNAQKKHVSGRKNRSYPDDFSIRKELFCKLR